MLIPAHHVIIGLINEFENLKPLLADSNVDGSASMAITNGLKLLLTRETGGLKAMSGRLYHLDSVLAQINDILGNATPKICDELGYIRKTLHQAQRPQALNELEENWYTALVRVQTLLIKINAEKSTPVTIKKAIGKVLSAWETSELEDQIKTEPHSESAIRCVDVNRDNLTAYLRDRFAESNLQVTSFQTVAGGFSKQTILFDVESKSLSGSFVMRREMGGHPSPTKDCHKVCDEYLVIKAAFERGFPAPDALWLDTKHRLLAGGDFIVMRRSPGLQAGSVFGARNKIPSSLTSSLAKILARLHTLSPMIELGDLTNSIRIDLWSTSRHECTERYIRDWYELYLNEEHTPSPALIAIYGWLLDNVPKRDGPPVLLHGDIGFHNFLFDNNNLSAVLDWEFAHIGDPAEELGYVKITAGSDINWCQLIKQYMAAGGDYIDEETLHYFQVWGYTRNATACNFKYTLFTKGHVDDLKLSFLPVAYYPKFIRGAQALIDTA